MQHMVAVETGEVLPLAAEVDGVDDGVAVAAESYADTEQKRKRQCVKWSQNRQQVWY